MVFQEDHLLEVVILSKVIIVARCTMINIFLCVKTTISLVTYIRRITYTISLIASWCAKISTREAHSTNSGLFDLDYNLRRNCINRTLSIYINTDYRENNISWRKWKYKNSLGYSDKIQHDFWGLFRQKWGLGVKFHGKAYISVFWKSSGTAYRNLLFQGFIIFVNTENKPTTVQCTSP